MNRASQLRTRSLCQAREDLRTRAQHDEDARTALAAFLPHERKAAKAALAAEAAASKAARAAARRRLEAVKAGALPDAAPAAAGMGETLPDTAYEEAEVANGVGAQGVETLASLAANGRELDGAGFEGSERTESRDETHSSAAQVPDESLRVPGEAGEAAAGDAVQLFTPVKQPAAAEAAADAATAGSSSAPDVVGGAERRQGAPALEEAGFAERQARSEASSDGASEQAAITEAPDALDAPPAPAGSEGAEADKVEGSPHTLALDPESADAEPGAAAEAAPSGALEVASAGGAADAGPAVTGEVGDADAVDSGDSGREPNASAMSEDDEALQNGGDGRTEARRARESLLKRSNSDKQLEQQVSPLQSFSHLPRGCFDSPCHRDVACSVCTPWSC